MFHLNFHDHGRIPISYLFFNAFFLIHNEKYNDQLNNTIFESINRKINLNITEKL